MFGLPALDLGFKELLVASSWMHSCLNPHDESSLSACFISAYQLFFIMCLFMGTSWVCAKMAENTNTIAQNTVPVLTYSQNIQNSCWEASSFQTPCFWGKLAKAPCGQPVAALLSPEEWEKRAKGRTEHDATPRFIKCSLWKPVSANTGCTMTGIWGGRWHSGGTFFKINTWKCCCH